MAGSALTYPSDGPGGPPSGNRLGDLAREAGDRAEATRRYQAGLTIAQRLVELAPDNTDFQQSLWTSFDRLADLAAEIPAAMDACQDVLRLVGDRHGSGHPLAEAVTERLREIDGPSTSDEMD